MQSAGAAEELQPGDGSNPSEQVMLSSGATAVSQQHAGSCANSLPGSMHSRGETPACLIQGVQAQKFMAFHCEATSGIPYGMQSASSQAVLLSCRAEMSD